MPCPSESCKAANPAQRALLSAEKAEITQEPWVDEAMICTYCGCVYTNSVVAPGQIRGYYDNALSGRGWSEI